MKKLILALLLITSANANFFQEQDKQVHILITAATSFGASAIAAKQGFSKQESFWVGVGTGILTGIVIRKFHDPELSSGDIVAGGIGSVLGSFTLIKIRF